MTQAVVRTAASQVSQTGNDRPAVLTFRAQPARIRSYLRSGDCQDFDALIEISFSDPQFLPYFRLVGFLPFSLINYLTTTYRSSGKSREKMEDRGTRRDSDVALW